MSVEGKQMDDLIERLEHEGPSQALDAAIAVASGQFTEIHGVNLDYVSKGRRRNAIVVPPPYTKSVDVAMTLLPPKHDLEMYFDDPAAAQLRRDTIPWVVQVGGPAGRFLQGRAKHGAMALCIACLRARATGAAT